MFLFDLVLAVHLVCVFSRDNVTLATPPRSSNSTERRLLFQIAVILPDRPVKKERGWMFAIQRVAPAIALALRQVHDPKFGLPFRLSVRYANSACDISEAINQVFNFYQLGNVDVFFGPCCDYAAAPVGRQVRYWNLPMITAGAMSADFGEQKRRMYHLLTRIGPNFNSLANFFLQLLGRLQWSKVKIFYDTRGRDDVMERFCYLAADSLHRSITLRSNVTFNYFQLEKLNSLSELLRTEIGRQYSGKTSSSSSSMIQNQCGEQCVFCLPQCDYVCKS